MRDLVLVPSFYRPEFLYLCLEKILAARGGPDKEIWISQDRHITDSVSLRLMLPEILQVIDDFRPRFRIPIRYIERRPHQCVGNVLNFLELYKEANQTPGLRYVYMIEEDVHIGPDFFSWHEAINVRRDYFCSVGWHCIRNREIEAAGASTDSKAYIETSRDFSSIGVCWKKESLAEIALHACDAYYRNHRDYLRLMFPKSPIPAAQWTEQAGLIMRLILDAGDRKVVAWPEVPRCAHVGINGYHRPGGYKFRGCLADKVEALRQASTSTEKISSLSADRFDDVSALPEASAWSPIDLYVSKTFKWEGKL